MSPGIQNDIIEQIRLHILGQLKPNFSSARNFAVLMDETTDVHHLEQVSITIRTVDEEGDNSEDFVGFHEGDDLIGRGLANMLVDLLWDSM